MLSSRCERGRIDVQFLSCALGRQNQSPFSYRLDSQHAAHLPIVLLLPLLRSWLNAHPSVFQSDRVIEERAFRRCLECTFVLVSAVAVDEDVSAEGLAVV